jgi:hypothetical protein
MPGKFLIINLFSTLPLQTHRDFFKRKKKTERAGRRTTGNSYKQVFSCANYSI